MCNQTVCLIAAEIERRGIATVCIMLLRDVAERVCPPRALTVPFPHGSPLGAPHDARQQREVMRKALALLERDAKPGLIEDL
jgi:D-proline reductase (dithiol) PrdB